MTNWMTAAGLALIAGGLATLISFRAMVFDGFARRGTPARRRRGGTASSSPAPRARVAAEPPLTRRRRLAASFSGRPDDAEVRDDGRCGLASIGLADEDDPAGPPEDEYAEAIAADEGEPDRYPGYRAPWPEAVSRPVVDRSDRRYGDRIDGWVRPRYPDETDRSAAGGYWGTSVSERYPDHEPSARGYGWPVPVERLPPVPPYEPATGFELTPVQAAEPTTLVPVWPGTEKRQSRRSRRWPSVEPAYREDPIFEEPVFPDLEVPDLEFRGRRYAGASAESDGGGHEAYRNRDARSGDGVESIAGRDRTARGRPRPRPRPTPAPGSNPAYVSRHAAGPQP